MKRLLLISFMSLNIYNVFADGHEVILYGDPLTNKPGGHKHEVLIPHVTYDEDYVTISSDSTQTVGVVIRSIEGSLLYQGVVDTSSNGTSLYVPSQPMDEKYSIDLYTEEQHLMGYF